MRKVEQVNLKSGTFTPWFNNPVEMAECLGSLEGLNTLIKARGEYGEFRPAPLNRMILSGLWFLDNYGQASPVSVRTTEQGKKILELIRRLPGVHSEEEFREQFTDTDPQFSWAYSFGSGQHIPPAGVVCTHCRKPWSVQTSTDAYINDTLRSIFVDPKNMLVVGKTLAEVREKLETIHDVNGDLFMRRYSILKSLTFIDDTQIPLYSGSEEMRPKNPEGWACADKHERNFAVIDWNTYVVQADDTLCFDHWEYIHLGCRTARLNEEIRNKFYSAIVAAGLNVQGSISIPNSYADEAYSGKWFLIETNVGIFRVGWRRHVISLLEVEYGSMEYNSSTLQRKLGTEDPHFNSYEELTTHLKKKFN